MEACNSCGKPSLQFSTARSGWQQINTETNFAEDYWVDSDFTFVVAKPLDDPLLRLRLRRFTQDVGINEICHSVSVDSDSIGTKYPLTGQSSSQSTSPSFDFFPILTTRYSPRSIRSTSNSCPGLMASCRFNADGKSSSPVLDTRVFMRCKVTSDQQTDQPNPTDRRDIYRVFDPIGVETFLRPRLIVTGTTGSSGQRAANSS